MTDRVRKTTYRDMQLELERLHVEQERTRRQDKSAALASIRALMAEYRITPDELRDLLERSPNS